MSSETTFKTRSTASRDATVQPARAPAPRGAPELAEAPAPASAAGYHLARVPVVSETRSAAAPSAAGVVQCFTPTADELTAGRARLKRADHGVLNPNLRGIRARRSAGESAADYYDHMLDARASINRLASQPTGSRMLGELNARTAAVNPGAVGDEQNAPLTVADVYSGKGLAPDSQMSASPRHDGTYGSVQKAYRYNGAPSAGQATRINYNGSAPKANRWNSLGHELVHAWRNAHGRAVSPPEVSPMHDHPLLNPPTPPVVRQVIGHHAQMQEEFETVGLSPTPNVAWAPTENAIRAEHGLPARDNYSGARPGDDAEMMRNVDQGTDDRSFFQKLNLPCKPAQPSPVAAIKQHLTD